MVVVRGVVGEHSSGAHHNGISRFRRISCNPRRWRAPELYKFLGLILAQSCLKNKYIWVFEFDLVGIT